MSAQDLDALWASAEPVAEQDLDAAWEQAEPVAAPSPTLDTVATVYKEEKLSLLGHALNKAADVFEWLEEVGPKPAPDVLQAQREGREAMRVRPGARLVLQDEQAREASPLAVPFYRYAESSRQMDIARLQFDLMAARTLGKDTAALEGQIEEAKAAAIPRDYDEGAFAQVFSDAAEGIASTVEVVKEGGIGAVVGGGVGAIPGALKRDPALARRGAVKGAEWLGKAGAALASFKLESGSAYGELLDATTDDGTRISEEEARGAAVIYGAMASGLEMASLGVLLKTMGPLGAAIRGGTGKAAMAELMRDAGFRQIAREAGKRLAKAGFAEGSTEALQTALEDAVGYFARSYSAGEFQATPQLSLEETARAFEKGAAGGLALGSVGVAVNATAQAIARDQARVAGRKVAALAELGESEAVREAPDAVAKLVEEATARDGEAVTHLYVDSREFMRLFQDGNVDEAARELLGEEGPRVLQEAVAIGGKLEIPLSVYLAKWGPKPIAKQLVDHTTTRPGLLTPAEVAAQEKEIQAEAEKIAAEEQAPEAEAEFADGLEAELVGTGLSRSEAKASVAPLRAFVRTQASRFGVDAEVLFRGFTVTAQKGEGEATPLAAQEQGAPDSVEAIVKDAQAEGVKLDLFERDKVISLPRIVVPKEARGAGIGTRVMERIAAYADATGKTIALTPSTAFGATSKKRLVEFYKRFGFVENKGRAKDFTISESMVRPPQKRLFEAALSGTMPRGYMERVGRHLKIVRNPNADLSTFLHETGHVFLEIFGDLAKREDAPQQVKDDWQAALKWMGSDGKITREQHEKWARGFEAYLMEGKSPSAKLVAVFERFKLWLTKIYRSALSLNVDLSPEIRDVFDRLLATDREIQRAQDASGHRPMPQDVLSMEPEQYQAYLDDMARATSKAARDAELAVLKERLRENERWWKEESARIRDEVAAEYEALPARKAERFLRGDIEGVKTPPTKLDLQAVVDVVGKERARKFLTAKKGGAQPADVAELLDYPGKRKRDRGRQMLLDIVSLPDAKTWTAKRADEVMRERHGDLLQERDLLRELVAGGLHSEQTAQWLLREWDALRKKSGQGKATLEAVKRAAGVIAERTAIGRLAPHVAQQRERTAAENAARAAAKGDFAQAAVFKQQQLLNMYLYRKLRDLRDEVDRIEASIERRMKSDTHRPDLGKASQDFLATHDALMGAVGFAQPVQDVGEALDAFDRAAELAASNGNPFSFDTTLARALIARPVAWKDLKPEQARQVRDAVKNIKAVANQINEITLAGEKRRVEEIVQAIAVEAERLPDLGKADADRALARSGKKILNAAVGLHGALVDPEHMFGTLGATATKLFQGYKDRLAEKFALTGKVLDPLLKLFKEIPKAVQAARFEPIRELDAELPMPEGVNLAGPRSMMWLFMVALNFGNESNRQRLRAFGWTDEQILAALDKHLPKGMWDLAQRIWDLFDHELWPQLEAKERKKKGIPPGKIQAASIKTQHGTYRGGYFPAVYDPNASVGDIGERQAMAGVASLFGMDYRRAYTPNSHTKERAETYENILLLDWNVFPSEIAQVIQDIVFDEYVRETGRVLLHPTFKEVAFRRLGERRKNEARDWLKFVANEQAVSAAAQSNEIARAAGIAKGWMVTQAIGWAANIAISDFSNAFVAMAAGREQGGTSFRYGLPAYLSALPHPLFGKNRRFALERSQELRTRVDSYTDERRKRYVRNFGKRFTRYSATVEAIANTAWWFLEQTDKMSATQIWLARYWQETADGMSDAEAVRLADQAVSSNLPTPDMAQRPKVAREPGSIGGILVFFGYFSKVYNILYGRTAGNAIRAWVDASRGDSTKSEAAWKTAELAARSAAIVFFSNVVGELLGGRGPSEDEEPEQWLLYKMMAGYANPLPFGATLEPAFQKVVTGETGFFVSPRAAPVLSLGEGAVKSLGKALDGEVEDEDRLWAAIEALVTLGPLPTGRAIPVRQEMKTFKYLEDLLSGDSDTDDPADVASGVLYGEREGQGANVFSIMGR